MACSEPIVKNRLIAHRGASAHAPENTIGAVRKAAEMGAKWVEVDVKLTADKQPVIIHDDELDRTTNGSGRVVNHTLDDIQRLSANNAGFDGYDDERIPTLRELLEVVLELDLGLQLELKPTAGDDEDTAEIALGCLKRIWPGNNSNLFLSSFSIRSLNVARQLLPEVPRAVAVCVPPRDPVSLLTEIGCQILHVTPHALSDTQLAILDGSAVEFAVATINDTSLAKRLLARGAQTILSDRPDLLAIEEGGRTV